MFLKPVSKPIEKTKMTEPRRKEISRMTNSKYMCRLLFKIYQARFVALASLFCCGSMSHQGL